MTNTYGTIASSGKNDFERFMEDMNKIGGYDSDKPTGSSTTATANQGTVTKYGSTPSYDRQDALLDRKERIATSNRNLEWGRKDYANAIQRGREDRARGDMLDAQRYNQLQDRNDRFQGWSDRAIAMQQNAYDKKKQAVRERRQIDLAKSAQKNEFALKNKELNLMSQKYNAEIAALNQSMQNAELDRALQREQLAQQKERDKWNVISSVFS